MDDVLIVGAGPAGSVAAAVLARAGVRVRLLDRAAFPRDKLCGDTVNPGTLAPLCQLLAGGADRRSRPARRRDARDRPARRRDRRPLSGRHPRARARAPRSGLGAAAAGDGRRGPVRSRPTLCARDRRRIGASHRRCESRSARNGRSASCARACHCRGRTAIDAGVRARARAASAEAATLGDRRVLRERPRPVVAGRDARSAHGRYIGVAPVPGGLANVCLVDPRKRRARF